MFLKFVADWSDDGSLSRAVERNATADNNVVYLTAQAQSPAVFNQFNTLVALPEWGTLYHAMKSVSGISLIRCVCS